MGKNNIVLPFRVRCVKIKGEAENDNDGLQKALEAARDEYEAVWKSIRDVEPDMVGIHEPRIREWYEQKVASLFSEIARLQNALMEKEKNDA